MINICIGLIFCFWVNAAAAQDEVITQKAKNSMDYRAETVSDGPQPNKEDMEIIAVMEILELMDLAEDMDMMQDLDCLIEENQNED
jgi:hypothetical protein